MTSNSPSSSKLFIALACAAILLLVASSPAVAMPPHPSLVEQWKSGELPVSEIFSNPKILAAKGINQPDGLPFGAIARAQAGGPTKAPPTGSLKVLAICIDYSDNTASVASTAFDALVYNAGGATVRNYYDEVSYTNVTVVTVNLPSTIGSGGALAGWQRAPQTYSYYVNGNYGYGGYPNNSQKMCEDIVNAIDPIVDFSNFDNDGDGFVDSIFLVHAGSGAEYTGNPNDI